MDNLKTLKLKCLIRSKLNKNPLSCIGCGTLCQFLDAPEIEYGSITQKLLEKKIATLGKCKYFEHNEGDLLDNCKYFNTIPYCLNTINYLDCFGFWKGVYNDDDVA